MGADGVREREDARENTGQTGKGCTSRSTAASFVCIRVLLRTPQRSSSWTGGSASIRRTPISASCSGRQQGANASGLFTGSSFFWRSR